MTKEEVLKLIKPIIEEIKGNVDSINDDDVFGNDLAFDSLDCVELIFRTEKELKINIPDEELINIEEMKVIDFASQIAKIKNI